MTDILYTVFSSENLEQRISHISIIVQHRRLKTELLRKQLNLHMKSTSPYCRIQGFSDDNRESNTVDKTLQIACACSRLLHW